MKKLNTYIVKQIFIGFLLVTFSLMSILWLTQSLRFVELITNKGLPVSLFIEMTSLLMPRLFAMLSPIALFIAVLFTCNRMLSDRELVVIKAAGISPWQTSKPIIFVGIILTFFSVYVNNFGIPEAEKKFNDLEWRVKNDFSHLFFREGEFTDLQYNLTVFVSSQRKDGLLSGILVNDERKSNSKVTLSADKGRIVYTDNKPRIVLAKGIRQEINKETGQFSSLSFDSYSIDFGGEGLKKNKEVEARELTLSELLNARNNPDLTEKEVRRHIVEGNRRLLSPLYNLLFALLGCTGLLVGSFNRRGQTKIISTSIFFMVVIMVGDLAFGNIAAKRLYLLPLMHINFFVPLVFCIYLLLFYNPAAGGSRKKRESFANV